METTEARIIKQAVRKAAYITKDIVSVQVQIKAARQALGNLRHMSLYDAANVIDMDTLRTVITQLEMAEEALTDQQHEALRSLYS